MLKKIPDYLHSTYKQIEVPDVKITVKKRIKTSIKDWSRKLKVSYSTLARKVNAGFTYEEIADWAKTYVERPRGKNIIYKGVPLAKYCRENGYNYQHVKYLSRRCKDINKVMYMIDSGEYVCQPKCHALNRYIYEAKGKFSITIKRKYLGSFGTREEAIEHRNRYLTQQGMEIPD